GDAGGRRAGRFGFRDLLVIAQIGASVVLLVGAGLFLRGLQSALETDLGFDSDGVAMMTRSLSEEETTPESAREHYRDLIQHLRGVPGVVDAAVARSVEVTFMPSLQADVSSRAGDAPVSAYYNSVTPGYLEMLEVPLLRGRTIEPGDRRGAPAVAVINETFAARLWPDAEAIGKRFALSRREGSEGASQRLALSVEVVGLTREGKYLDIDDGPLPYFWMSFYQDDSRDAGVLVKGAGKAEEMVEVLRREVEVGDRELTLIPPTTLESQVDVQYLVPRLASRLFAFGGAFGLILSVIGVYGLVSFAVSRRTREMAIRMALGARADQILSRVVRDGMRLVVMGLAGGMVTVVALAYVARLLLYGVSPVDPTALLSGAAVILVAALAACVVPALRATRIDALATLLDD
ncbi:MAG: ABC transporter permease, partial [Deltaproteobacteria bacterium]|nr:ABC transporter permease [Deltaproteobacteria bacterium]